MIPRKDGMSIERCGGVQARVEHRTIMEVVDAPNGDHQYGKYTEIARPQNDAGDFHARLK